MIKFLGLDQLETAIFANQNFNNEIKGKRLKKELSMISNLQMDFFDNIANFITPTGFTIRILVKCKGHSPIFDIKVDHQYPFNRPQVYSIDNQKYGQCRDLLDNLLENRIWGPSMMLCNIIQKLSKIEKNRLQNPEAFVWSYHNGFQYWEQELKTSGLKLFNADRYQWKYMIKNTKKRIIGVTNDTFFIFNRKTGQILLLQFWTPISEIKQVKSVIQNKNIEISVQDENLNNNLTMYLGNIQNIQNVLDYIDPVQMAERRILLSEKSGHFDNAKAIKDYSQLVEHYSLRDKNLTARYVQSLRKLIQREYGEQKIVQKQLKEEDDIKKQKN